jgi:hypothetical protein
MPPILTSTHRTNRAVVAAAAEETANAEGVTAAGAAEVVAVGKVRICI